VVCALEWGAVQAIETWGRNWTIGISAVTYMELLVGCRNKREQRSVDSFVKIFELILVNERITEEAIHLLRRYRLSHGLLIADPIIAATALVESIPLAARNQKDYRGVSALAISIGYLPLIRGR